MKSESETSVKSDLSGELSRDIVSQLRQSDLSGELSHNTLRQLPPLEKF